MRIVYTLVVGTLLTAAAVPAGAQQPWGNAGEGAAGYGQWQPNQAYVQQWYAQQAAAQSMGPGGYYAQAASPYYGQQPMQYPRGYGQASFQPQPMANQQPTPAEAVQGQPVDENGQPYLGDGTDYPPDGYDPGEGYEEGVAGGGAGGPAVGVRPASIFTWQPQPTGTRFSTLAGPPYAALRAKDGDDPMGLIMGMNTVRSRLGQPYFKAEALMLRRSNPQGDVTILQNLQTGDTELSSADLKFKNQLGYRLTAGMAFNERQAFEVSYFAVQSWNVTSGVVAPGLVSIPAPLAFDSQAFQFADSANISYGTMLWNAEANFMQTTVFENWTVLAGFRFLEIKDGFDLLLQHPTFGTAAFNEHTRNRMTGGQIGVAYRRNIDLFTIEVIGKAGAYGNFAQQYNPIVDFNGQYLRTDTLGNKTIGYAQVGNSSFVGDVNINGIYHFNNFVSLKIGYNFLAVTRLALAPNQLDFNDIAGVSGFQLNHSENLFFYGLNVGLDARF